MGRTQEEKMAVAEEIVRQLGGRRFILITGAYDFLTLDHGVRFRLPGGNLVEVILEPNDTYRVRFLKATGEAVSEHDSIYNDQLQELFTRETGLETHLQPTHRSTITTDLRVPSSEVLLFWSSGWVEE